MLMLAMLIQAAAPNGGAALQLNLICRGRGTTMAQVGTETVTARDNWGNAAQAQSVRQGLVDYDTTAGFRLQD
ncbi:MAG: hypothetical protein ACXW2T_05985, partial [Allosphingosinicella sp.]